jgi:hypothetical protein
LGIYIEKTDDDKKQAEKSEKPDKLEFVEILGRGVPAVTTPQGLRAAIKGEVIQPQTVKTYLEQKFGADYEDSRSAMEQLAKAFMPKQLESNAYELYEKFRPQIPEGTKGWGAKGELDLEYIRSLAEK